MTDHEATEAVDRPLMPVPRTIYVKVSTELLGELGEWSEPVRARIERQHDDTFELVFRRLDVRQIGGKW